LKDTELEEHLNQKIEEIRSEISALKAILEPEQEIEEQVNEETQTEELIEPIEIYQEFQLSSY